jgi:SAM-dependent methyltransferase
MCPKETDFERLYQAEEDPWGYRTSWYERRKYAITMACLPRLHYRAVWEPACSIGELTALLAHRSTRVAASDVSATAVAAARSRLADHSGVRVEQARLPSPAPGTPGDYDLVVFSEVLYYLPEADREACLQHAERAVGDDGDLVVVHWRHHPDDAWVAGEAVNAAIRSRTGWRAVARHDERDFVLDVLSRVAARPA